MEGKLEEKDIATNPASESRSLKFLYISTVLSFVFFALTIFGFFYFWQLDQKSTNSVASANNLSDNDKYDPASLLSLAENLSKAGFVLYGSENDEKTKKQLEIFGQARDIIDFVDCESEVSTSGAGECSARGVKNYPVWARGESFYYGTKSAKEMEKLLILSRDINIFTR